MYLRVVGEGVRHLVAGWQMFYGQRHVDGGSNDLSESGNAVRLIRTYVEYLVARLRYERGSGYCGSHIRDVGKCPSLRPVAEDRHCLALQRLVYEDPDYVPIRIRDVLPLAIQVVGSEDRVVQTKH